jgi:hypothetical protein
LFKDALHRNESCGGFREVPIEDGEAQRDDENFAYVAAWVTLVNQAKLFCTRTTGV